MSHLIKSLQKHQRFVRIMRFILPVFAGSLMLLLLAWPQIQKKTDYISSSLKNALAPTYSKAQVDMKKVQFYSEDKKGRPFTITSDKILEIDPMKSLVQLDNPKGEMTLNSGVKIFSHAPLAWFYQNTDIVFFRENLHMLTDNGYRADASAVIVDYKSQLAYSKNAIQIRGEKADLDATGFHMRQNGAEIDFYGPAKTILRNLNKNQTVVITADKMFEVRQKTQTISAFENVLADDGVNKLYSDEMTAYFKSVDKNRYELKSVQAQRNVKIITQSEIITGNDAFYDLAKEKAFITGNVVVQRAQGDVSGDRAIIDMKTGQSQLEVDYTKQNKPRRVKGTIYPTRIKNQEK